MMAKGTVFELIYDKEWSRTLMHPLFVKLFTNDPAVTRVNRELRSCYISVSKNTRGKRHKSIVPLIVSISMMVYLVFYTLRYILILCLPPDSVILPFLGDYLFPLGPSGHWIYYFFNVGMVTAIANRFIIAFFSFRGEMHLYKDWKHESTSIYNTPSLSISENLIKLERWNIYIYDLVKATGVYSNFLVGALAFIMFVISTDQLIEMNTPNLYVVVHILWTFTFFPALYFSVNGVIYPLALSMCGVFYSMYLIEVCMKSIESVQMSTKKRHFSLSISDLQKNLSPIMHLCKSVSNLRLTIHKQGHIISALLIVFISFATFSASSNTFLAFYVQFENGLMQYFSGSIAIALWMMMIIIPAPLTNLPDQIDLIHKQLNSLQCRYEGLTVPEKYLLLRLIELVENTQRPIAYTIINGRPYSSSLHFSLILNIITVIFLMINLWQGRSD